MKIFEREQLIREDGKAEGRAEGRAEVVEIVRKKQEKHMPAEKIAEILELDREYVEKIVTLLEENSGMSDQDIARKSV